MGRRVENLKDGPHFSWRSGITRHERLAAKLLQGGLLLLLLAAICLGGYSSLLSHQLASARQQAAECAKTGAAGRADATLQTQMRKTVCAMRSSGRNGSCANNTRLIRGNTVKRLKTIPRRSASARRCA